MTFFNKKSIEKDSGNRKLTHWYMPLMFQKIVVNHHNFGHPNPKESVNE